MSYSSDHPVWTPTCAVCNGPVELETCNTDERGSAVHEECYVRKMRVKAGLVPIPPLRESPWVNTLRPSARPAIIGIANPGVPERERANAVPGPVFSVGI
jgi:hypothetical protein